LKNYMIRFNWEAVVILDLQERVAYKTFPNELLLRRFKFFFAESKTTTLIETSKRIQDFIHAIEIYATDDFIRYDVQNRGKEYKGTLSRTNVRRKKRRGRDS